MVRCPECKGAGSIRGFGCPGMRPIMVGCHMCKGTKEISEEQIQWIKDGEAMRQDRRKRGVGVRDEAKHRGINPSYLTDMEFGVQKPIRAGSGTNE